MPTGRAFLALGALLVASPAVASLQFDAEFSLPAHSETIAADVFEASDDGRVHIHGNHRPDSDRTRMQQAVTQCPAAALLLTEDDG